MSKVIGLVGFIGSGKTTVANILAEDHGFTPISYAGSLKDAIASIFSWPRDMLEGTTEASRVFRERKDEWWSEKFGRPITPRHMLQYFGTEVMRNNLHQDIWILSVLKRIESNPEKDYVITDVRFRNEIKMVLEHGGEIIRIRRAPEEPEWFSTARYHPNSMKENYPEVHPSEYDWVADADKVKTMENYGTLEHLKISVNMHMIMEARTYGTGKNRQAASGV